MGTMQLCMQIAILSSYKYSIFSTYQLRPRLVKLRNTDKDVKHDGHNLNVGDGPIQSIQQVDQNLNGLSFTFEHP